MKKLVLLGFIAFLLSAVHAQTPSISREVIAAGGDFFVTSNGSLSWTLGEPVIETFENGSIQLILTQGFQQPDEFEKNDTVGIWEKPSSNVFVSLYPNPTAQSITLDLKYDQNSKIRIELVDLLGRVLHSDNQVVLKGQLSNYRLDVTQLAAGMYLFRLTDNGKLLNSYKFQKVSN